MLDEFRQFCELADTLKRISDVGKESKIVEKFQEYFVGPECVLMAAFRHVIVQPRSETTNFDKALDVVADAVEKNIANHDRQDPSLVSRWLGIVAALRACLKPVAETESQLTIARNHFAEAFRKLDPPSKEARCGGSGSLDAVVNNKKRRPSTLEDFAQTAARFLLDDWQNRLSNLQVTASPFAKLGLEIEEVTPILTVIDGVPRTGTVQDLVVRMGHLPEDGEDAPERLVFPNLLAFGLARLMSGDQSFVAEMHRGFRSGRIPVSTRICWHIAPREDGGQYPAGFSGPSAQVSAACCTRALADRGWTDRNQLLDRRVAATACLEKYETDQPKPEKWAITPDPDLDGTRDRGVNAGRPKSVKARRDDSVGEVGLLLDKFVAAARAKLIAIQICKEQIQNYEEWRECGHTTLIQPVSTLEHAYQALLITSHAVVAYKKKIHDEWLDDWDPQATPEPDAPPKT